ncbi:MAG TPA: hypothetical protein VF472_19335 [Burkholderiaceae bacterium]
MKRSLMAAAVACAYIGTANAGVVKDDEGTVYKPTGKGWGQVDIEKTNQNHAAATKARRSTNLTLQGGPVMTAAKNIYYIWYGSSWDSASKTLLTNLGQHIGGSPYFNINTTYYNSAGTHVQNSVTLAGSTTNSGTLGTSLSDANIETIVSNAITSGALPSDANGIYFVLTDKNTTATSGFCTQYCGWHTNASIGGKDIKYAFIGDAETQCPSACGATSPSPNNLPGADSMASIIAHEMEEATTDPDGNAWYSTSSGNENGDMCAWNFGTTSTASNGASYNQTFGTTKYLIQQNWVIASTQHCAQHYP